MAEKRSMKKGNLLLAGLAAGAYAYFKKPENREKAIEAFNNTKAKVSDIVDAQKKTLTDKAEQFKNTTPAEALSPEPATADVENTTHPEPTAEDVEHSAPSVNHTGDQDIDYLLNDKGMVSEGAGTTVHYYNEQQSETDSTKH